MNETYRQVAEKPTICEDVSTAAKLPASARILRRPHFRRVGDDLFFLISSRPHTRLSASDAIVWTALEDNPSVGDLRAHLGDVDGGLRRFQQLGLCEIAEANFPSVRRRILILEPHSDDAVLSVGGTMWLRRHECEFNVVTIGSRSNFTSYYYLDRDYFNVDEISSLRRAEGVLFTRLLGGKYQTLDQPEAALRYHGGNWSFDWYRKHRLPVGAFIAHHSGSEELRVWTEAIREVLQHERVHEVWLPLGGPHTDHQLTRDASLTLMRDNPKLFEGLETRFYQDVPYAARSPEFTPTVVQALRKAGVVLSPEVVEISSAFSEKLRLVSLYGSQFKIEAIGPEVEKNARMAAEGGGLAERFWLVQKPPTVNQPLSIRFDEPIIRHAAKRLAPWVERHRNSERIRLLLLVPAGRWAEDMEFLLETFPKARFDAYVAIVAETDEFDSSRIHVTHIGSGPRAWMLLSIRLMMMRPAPTLFMAGEKRLRAARRLSRLWLMSDSIVVPTMDHLTSALRQLGGNQS
jgi:LmbE family N-acetylglucosaminyl deacetylase